MRRVAVCLFSILMVFSSALAHSRPANALVFSECFLKYDPMSGETEMILYNIRSDQEVVMSNEAFAALFELSHFEISEVSYDSLENPTAVRVMARTDNFLSNEPVQQLFTNILGGEAQAGLVGDSPMDMVMRIVFPKQKHMYVADNNAERVLANESRGLIMMEFDMSGFPARPFEAVIGWQEKGTGR